MLNLLKKSGIREYNLAHVDDAGLNHDIPIGINQKFYDLSYISPDGEIFLIEVMRLGKTMSERITRQKKKGGT